jgi:hypothetical protein
MIENSDDDSASDLYDEVNGAEGIDDANRVFGLQQTTVGTEGYWGLTTTTADDQIRLLRQVFTRPSMLSSASQDYIKDLMSQVEADQQWGVPAAADPDTQFMVKNGWLPNPTLWEINSIGEIVRDHQRMLVAVLSDDNASESSGIAVVEAVAKATAESMAAAARPADSSNALSGFGGLEMVVPAGGCPDAGPGSPQPSRLSRNAASVTSSGGYSPVMGEDRACTEYGGNRGCPDPPLRPDPPRYWGRWDRREKTRVTATRPGLGLCGTPVPETGSRSTTIGSRAFPARAVGGRRGGCVRCESGAREREPDRRSPTSLSPQAGVVFGKRVIAPHF